MSEAAGSEVVMGVGVAMVSDVSFAACLDAALGSSHRLLMPSRALRASSTLHEVSSTMRVFLTHT